MSPLGTTTWAFQTKSFRDPRAKLLGRLAHRNKELNLGWLTLGVAHKHVIQHGSWTLFAIFVGTAAENRFPMTRSALNATDHVGESSANAYILQFTLRSGTRRTVANLPFVFCSCSAC